uniref:Uncharacterized protein n=1 Tax=Mycena chlorophos TaxID=658473 RepID=A0ABQ0LM70_MYCCL|nr:predicted protein [Mycena chlorophos]
MVMNEVFFNTISLHLSTPALRAVHDRQRDHRARKLVCVLEDMEGLQADLGRVVRVALRGLFLSKISLNLGMDVFTIAHKLDHRRRKELFDGLIQVIRAMVPKAGNGPLFVVQPEANAGAGEGLIFTTKGKDVLKNWSFHDRYNQFGRPTVLERMLSALLPADPASYSTNLLQTPQTHARLSSGTLTLVPALTSLSYLTISVISCDPGTSHW